MIYDCVIHALNAICYGLKVNTWCVAYGARLFASIPPPSRSRSLLRLMARPLRKTRTPGLWGVKLKAAMIFFQTIALIRSKSRHANASVDFSTILAIFSNGVLLFPLVSRSGLADCSVLRKSSRPGWNSVSTPRPPYCVRSRAGPYSSGIPAVSATVIKMPRTLVKSSPPAPTTEPCPFLKSLPSFPPESPAFPPSATSDRWSKAWAWRFEEPDGTPPCRAGNSV
jgi:hypothetical protein